MKYREETEIERVRREAWHEGFAAAVQLLAPYLQSEYARALTAGQREKE
jgi:hypothetical protein